MLRRNLLLVYSILFPLCASDNLSPVKVIAVSSKLMFILSENASYLVLLHFPLHVAVISARYESSDTSVTR